AYMAFKAGVLIIQPQSASALKASTPLDKPNDVLQQLLWLAAFLAGFSDRFADSVLRNLTGRLGGDRQSDFLSADRPAAIPKFTMTAIAELLSRGNAAGASGTHSDRDNKPPKPTAKTKVTTSTAEERGTLPPAQHEVAVGGSANPRR